MAMAVGLGVTSFASANNEEKTVTVKFMVHSTAQVANPPADVTVNNVKLDSSATVKDAIDQAAKSANVTIEWAEDTYSDPSGWYITNQMGLTSQYIDSGITDEGLNYYKSNSTILYQIPSNEVLNVTENTYDNPQALTLYASSVQAIDGNTIYVVYQRTYSEWSD